MVTNDRTRKALDVVAKRHGSKNAKNATRNLDIARLVIAHPDLYRDPWHAPARTRAWNALDAAAVQVAAQRLPLRNVDPALLRKLHNHSDLSIALAEHEFWSPETDPRDVEHYLKHSKGYLIGIGPDEAMTLVDLTEGQQTRLVKAALCGSQPFRPVGSGKKYTVMGETLVNLWNTLESDYVLDYFSGDEIDALRTRLARAVLKAYRQCHAPRSTARRPGSQTKNAAAEIDRAFASPLTTNAKRNRAATTVRRAMASAPRSRLALGARALEMAMRDYARYIRTRWYADPFLSPYSDILKTILKSA